jgi:hypothetical protein
LLTMKLREGVSFTVCQQLFGEYFPVVGGDQGSVGVVSTQFVVLKVKKNRIGSPWAPSSTSVPPGLATIHLLVAETLQKCASRSAAKG